MATTLTVYDETLSGERVNELSLDFLTEHITVRELIRGRIYEEVRLYNLSAPEYFKGLVQPVDAETVLNGYKMREKRKIDWEQQYQKAIEVFERNGFVILVDDRQVESLNERIALRIGTLVTFIKLVPLVGG